MMLYHKTKKVSKTEISTRQQAGAVKDLIMLVLFVCLFVCLWGMWKTLQLWASRVVTYCNQSIMGYLNGSLGDSTSQS